MFEEGSVLGGPGDDLLSRVFRQSTIGAEAFDGRVRDGIGSDRLAKSHQAGKGRIRRTEDGERKREFRRLSSVLYRRKEAKPVSEDGGPRTEDGKESSVLCRLFSVVRARKRALANESEQVERAISTGKLNALLRLHARPIDVVVFHGSSGRTGFEAGFPLRCLQRLSIPYIATLHRRWRDDRSTRDTFTPVLSY